MSIELTEINTIIQQMYAHFHEKNQHVQGFKLFSNSMTVYITEYYEEDESFDGCDELSYAFPRNISYSKEDLSLLNKIIDCVLSDLYENVYALSFILSITKDKANDEYIIKYKPYPETSFINVDNLSDIPEREIRLKEYMVKSRQIFLIYAIVLRMLQGEYSEKNKEEWQSTIAKYTIKNENLKKEGYGEIINEYLAENTSIIDYAKKNIAKIELLSQIKVEIEQKMQRLSETELNDERIYNEYIMKIR